MWHEQMTAPSLIRLLHPSRILKLFFAFIMTFLVLEYPRPIPKSSDFFSYIVMQ